jgi:hypothetical protein
VLGDERSSRRPASAAPRPASRARTAAPARRARGSRSPARPAGGRPG